MVVEIVALCDNASMSEGGKLNINGVFNLIHAASYPVMHPQMFLALRLASDSSELGTHRVEFRLVDADGGTIVGQDGTFTVPPPPEVGLPTFSQLIFHMVMVQFPAEGDYSLDVFVDGRFLVSAPLYLRAPGER